MAEKYQEIINKRTSVKDRIPTSAICEYGEILVNYNVDSPMLSIRKTDNNIAIFRDQVYNDAKYMDSFIVNLTVTGTSDDMEQIYCVADKSEEEIKALQMSGKTGYWVSEVLNAVCIISVTMLHPTSLLFDYKETDDSYRVASIRQDNTDVVIDYNYLVTKEYLESIGKETFITDVLMNEGIELSGKTFGESGSTAYETLVKLSEIILNDEKITAAALNDLDETKAGVIHSHKTSDIIGLDEYATKEYVDSHIPEVNDENVLLINTISVKGEVIGAAGSSVHDVLTTIASGMVENEEVVATALNYLNETKANVTHSHEMSDIDGLSSAISAKADLNHTHSSLSDGTYTATMQAKTGTIALTSDIDDALTGGVKYKGATSGLPSTTTVKAGDLYIATTGFTIPAGRSGNGSVQNVEEGDFIIAKTGGATSKWDSFEKNVDGAVSTTADTLASNNIILGDGNRQVKSVAASSVLVGSASTSVDSAKLGGIPASSYSTSAHTHSYLPLEGGTMNGNISMNENCIVDIDALEGIEHTNPTGEANWNRVYGDSVMLNSYLVSDGYGICIYDNDIVTDSLKSITLSEQASNKYFATDGTIQTIPSASDEKVKYAPNTTSSIYLLGVNGTSGTSSASTNSSVYADSNGALNSNGINLEGDINLNTNNINDAYNIYSEPENPLNIYGCGVNIKADDGEGNYGDLKLETVDSNILLKANNDSCIKMSASTIYGHSDVDINFDADNDVSIKGNVINITSEHSTYLTSGSNSVVIKGENEVSLEANKGILILANGDSEKNGYVSISGRSGQIMELGVTGSTISAKNNGTLTLKGEGVTINCEDETGSCGDINILGSETINMIGGDINISGYSMSIQTTKTSDRASNKYFATDGSIQTIPSAPTSVASATTSVSANTSADSAKLGGTAASGYSKTGHTHAISDVTNLQTSLDEKSDTGHTHDDLYQAKGSYLSASTSYAPCAHTHTSISIDSVSKSATTDGLTMTVSTKDGSVTGVTFTGTVTTATSATTSADSAKLGGTAASGYSKTGHTHTYLPLSGGSMTGSIVMGSNELDEVGGLYMDGTIDMNNNDIENVGTIYSSEIQTDSLYLNGNTIEDVSGIYHEDGDEQSDKKVWTTNGGVLDLSSIGGDYLPLSGGVMTGDINMNIKNFQNIEKCAFYNAHGFSIRTDHNNNDSSVIETNGELDVCSYNGDLYMRGAVTTLRGGLDNGNGFLRLQTYGGGDVRNIAFASQTFYPEQYETAPVSLGNEWNKWYNLWLANKAYAQNGFYQTSDERLKTFTKDVEVDFEKLSKLPKKLFYWKDDELAQEQIGTSAQELQKIYPELVSEDANGTLTVAYDKLSIIALAAIDKQQEEINSLRAEIEEIKKMLKK